jgi:flagellar assembly protein FliH
LPDAHPAGSGERVSAWQPPDLRTLAAPSTPERPGSGPTREEAAYALGWEEGRAALAVAGEQDLEHAASAWQSAASAMHRTAEGLQGQFTETVNLMSVAIAWHLLGREFATDPDHLQQLISRALVLAPLSGPVVVRLHPEDLRVIHQLPGALTPPVPATVEMSWVADETVLRGGCLIEGPATVIDGRLDRALLDIYERLSHG